MAQSLAKTKRVQSNRLAIRETLQAGEYLRQIQQIDEIVSERWQDLEVSQIQALKLKADINFKRLAKILPDLKSMELVSTDKEGQHERLLNLLDSKAPPIDVSPNKQ